jgi:hypothetical protein
MMIERSVASAESRVTCAAVSGDAEVTLVGE